MSRIAWFSPLATSSCSLSAEFSRRALACLHGHDVSLFINDSDWQQREHLVAPAGLPVYHYLRAHELQEKAPFDVFCYQWEDRADNDFCLRLLNIFPGVIFCHDLDCSRVIAARFSHITTGFEFNEELKAVYGQYAPALGEYLVRRAPLRAMQVAFPLPLQHYALQGVLVPVDQMFGADQEALAAENMLSYPLASMAPARRIRPREQVFQENGINPAKPVIGYALQDILSDRLAVVEAALGKASKLAGCNLLILLGVDVCGGVRERAARLVTDFPALNVRVATYHNTDELASLVLCCDCFLAPSFAPLQGMKLAARFALEGGLTTVLSGTEYAPQDARAVKIKGGAAEDDALMEALDNWWQKRAVAERRQTAEEQASFSEQLATVFATTAETLAKQYSAKVEAIGRAKASYQRALIASDDSILKLLNSYNDSSN